MTYPTEAILLINANLDEVDKQCTALFARADRDQLILCMVQKPEGFIEYNLHKRTFLLSKALAGCELVWASKLEKRPMAHQVQLLVILADGRASVIYRAAR